MTPREKLEAADVATLRALFPLSVAQARSIALLMAQTRANAFETVARTVAGLARGCDGERARALTDVATICEGIRKDVAP